MNKRVRTHTHARTHASTHISRKCTHMHSFRRFLTHLLGMHPPPGTLLSLLSQSFFFVCLFCSRLYTTMFTAYLLIPLHLYSLLSLKDRQRQRGTDRQNVCARVCAPARVCVCVCERERQTDREGEGGGKRDRRERDREVRGSGLDGPGRSKCKRVHMHPSVRPSNNIQLCVLNVGTSP